MQIDLFHREFLWEMGVLWSFPGGSDGKESTCNAGDLGSIPELGRCPGEGNGYSFQYSCMENPMDRGAWQPIVHGFSESKMTEVPWHAHMYMYVCVCVYISSVQSLSHVRLFATP